MFDTVYILIECWDGGEVVYNDGFKTEKAAQRRAKKIEDETGNPVNIHTIFLKKRRKKVPPCVSALNSRMRKERRGLS